MRRLFWLLIPFMVWSCGRQSDYLYPWKNHNGNDGAKPPTCTLKVSATRIPVGQSFNAIIETQGDVQDLYIDGNPVGHGPKGSLAITPRESGNLLVKGEVRGPWGISQCKVAYESVAGIVTLKPALAIAGTGCIMCHSKVHSNVVTTMGFPEAYFYGNGPGGGVAQVYGNYNTNWESAALYGKIYVPKADMPKNLTGGQKQTLAERMRNTVSPPEENKPKPEVIEAGKIFIGAPSAQLLLDSAGVFPPEHPDWKFIKDSDSSPEFSGLVTTGQVYTNDPKAPLVCDGDLVVRSHVLSLNNLTLKTTQGCRIYDAGSSILLHGPIKYDGPAATANLQMTSSRAILVGLGKGPYRNLRDGTVYPASDQARLTIDVRCTKFLTHEFPKDAAANLQAILKDNQSAAVLDPVNEKPLGRNVSFQRLFLNAPIVHNRYTGNFSGMIVAEAALAGLGDFVFSYDSVFDNVRLLPLIPESSYFSMYQK